MWWIPDSMRDQIIAQHESGGPPPNTLFGLPITGPAEMFIDGVFVGTTVGDIEVDDESTSVADQMETIREVIAQPDQCDFTAATIKLNGLTKRRACPPILSRRSHRCPCGRKKRNGKPRPFKTCCGKVSNVVHE